MPIPESMICRCLRCGHEWVKRIDRAPLRCPGCKQREWDRPAGKVGRPRKQLARKTAKGKK